MNKVKCRYAHVRFSNFNFNQQRLSYTDADACSYLLVSMDDNKVYVEYVLEKTPSDLVILKSLLFNAQHILEVSLDGFFT